MVAHSLHRHSDSLVNELTTPGPQSSPIYIVYKIGGDPGEGQFLSNPPKEIPHGYTACTYLTASVQRAQDIWWV